MIIINHNEVTTLVIAQDMGIFCYIQELEENLKKILMDK